MSVAVSVHLLLYKIDISMTASFLISPIMQLDGIDITNIIIDYIVLFDGNLLVRALRGGRRCSHLILILPISLSHRH